MPTATPACYLLLLACTSTWREGLVSAVLEERVHLLEEVLAFSALRTAAT